MFVWYPGNSNSLRLKRSIPVALCSLAVGNPGGGRRWGRSSDKLRSLEFERSMVRSLTLLVVCPLQGDPLMFSFCVSNARQAPPERIYLGLRWRQVTRFCETSA